MESSAQVWIAKIEGPVLGAGLSLLAASSIAICTPDAWFALPELKSVGTFPSAVVEDIADLIGPRAAMGMAISCRRVGAIEALQLGLVTEVVSPEQMGQRAEEIAAAIAGAAGLGRTVSEVWHRTKAGPKSYTVTG
jgi:enoyl-CoA hydratase/carnithine racemase